ncbi:MAG TPA: glycoside hydrolase family 38 C-terminal domain-containing protein [Acidobacteriaceae bacterium]|nr:glycoside hydrolase family 38 C-terminal domain-containing protein [Acidobacteriaceae bacterium]
MSRMFAGLVTASLVLGSGLCAAQSSSAPQPDLNTQPTLYVVGYAHLDTEWRWEYPQVIDEYLPNTMHENFDLIQKYPHYIFNFTGANRYRLMKEYYPADFARLKQYVAEGRWYPAGSSVEEGDVNAPSAESIIRQVLYGNDWFRKEFGRYSAEYMLPDCFGFPADLPTILATAGVKGFSTQKLTWGSSAPGGGPDSLEKTPEGTPFNVGVWVGTDGESVLAALNPGAYSGGIYSDLSKPLPALPPDDALTSVQDQLQQLRSRLEAVQAAGQQFQPDDVQHFTVLRNEIDGLEKARQDEELNYFQHDWAARVQNNGKITGVFTDYHYYGTGDIGGAPDEASVKRLEAIVTHGEASLPPPNYVRFPDEAHGDWPAQPVGNGPVHVISATADQMFLNITPAERDRLPEYTGEMELTNHSAGSLTSQAYQKRWLRKEELLADAAEKASVTASWLGGRTYPLERLNNAWTLVMGGQFHDLAAGTATPKAYEFAWNDDVIAMNQFAGVLRSATQAVSDALDTAGSGIPVVVFNPLNIERQGIVAADVHFSGGTPTGVSVTGPDGKAVPAQISAGKVVFLAKVPSVGYAVYSVQPGHPDSAASSLHVTESSLENRYYRVRIDSHGDIASIFDKQLGKELLAAPMRLAISYDNPTQWPAWNMDWDQEQAPPKEYVGGPATIRVVENGPARVAVQVTRETAGSKFVQTVRLSAGEAGQRVEIANAIDWNTRESNLKAVFALTAHNEKATYNLGIGTIQRPGARPRKFEVLGHQWVDLTDASGAFGATLLTDCKNGSDKLNDNTIRLTLIRTPGVQGGYPDQASQDLGHHEFVFGIAGHADDWRQGQTDWQGQELNDPLVAFTTAKHSGKLGREFSLIHINNPRIRIMALKKAENSNEFVLRLVELDGKPQSDVRISFAAPIHAAREVNGQEQPLGPAVVKDGALVTSFTAYQPRTFALTLDTPSARVPEVHSVPVTLSYDLAAASNTGDPVTGGIDGDGNALPAEMLPSTINYHGVAFHLVPAHTGTPDALIAKGQTLQLPAGDYNRGFILATAVDGDQEASFHAGNQATTLRIEDWGGFIGQWDDRVWQAGDVTTPARPGRPARTEHDDYAKLVGIRPGYIKRAQLAWYCSHHHDASGKNVAYSYSYLFAYPIDLPAGARSITLPNNDKVRILAVSVARENPAVDPVQPLYDTLGRSEPGPMMQP